MLRQYIDFIVDNYLDYAMKCSLPFHYSLSHSDEDLRFYDVFRQSKDKDTYEYLKICCTTMAMVVSYPLGRHSSPSP